MGSGRNQFKFKTLSRRDWRVLSFCIALAATIWLLRALNKDATTLVDIRVEVLNGLPAGYEITPSFIEVELEGSGFLLLRTKYFKNLKPLEIEACQLDSVHQRCAIHTSEFNRSLRQVVGSDRSILNTQPDSIIILQKPVVTP